MNFSNIFTNPKIVTRERATLDQGNPDFNPADAMLEYLLMSEDSYFNIAYEHMTSLHLALKDENIEILEEGFKDFTRSAAEFFKKLIKKVKEFFAKSYMYLRAYIGNFDTFLKKYSNKIKDAKPDFNMQGFNYTLVSSTPQTDKIQELIAEYNSDLEKLKNPTKEINIVKMMKDKMSTDQFDKIRGYVINSSSPVLKEDYVTEIRKTYRDGTNESINIHVNKSMFDKALNSYGDVKKELENCKKQRDKIILLLDSLQTFFSRGAAVHYDGKVKKINTRAITTNTKGNAIVPDKETQKTDYDTRNLDIINKYYSIKFRESREIGAMVTLAITEKVNALKECLVFYKKIMQRSITSKTEEGSEIK